MCYSKTFTGNLRIYCFAEWRCHLQNQQNWLSTIGCLNTWVTKGSAQHLSGFLVANLTRQGSVAQGLVTVCIVCVTLFSFRGISWSWRGLKSVKGNGCGGLLSLQIKGLLSLQICGPLTFKLFVLKISRVHSNGSYWNYFVLFHINERWVSTLMLALASSTSYTCFKY